MMRNRKTMACVAAMVMTVGGTAYAQTGGAGEQPSTRAPYPTMGRAGPQGGYGPGMTGPQGAWGPGMMSGGYGGWPGTMGDGGMGPGAMMGYGPGIAGLLDLDARQQQLVEKIQADQIEQQLQLMQKMHEQAQQLQQLYSAEDPDVQAVGKVYDQLFDLRKRSLLNHLQARKQLQDVLNEEQRDRLRQMQQLSRNQWHW